MKDGKSFEGIDFIALKVLIDRTDLADIAVALKRF
jgi:hypothetical protein